ncbi:MarR family transcriptional regulator [Cohnella sp. CFH 77786]|uniref:MarR family winged helix-turn-helix transcriptional regulator n=1 Tax=Cohnella sp. CFH 77786 TaxID=2662265 RepID=UPI001C609478|nr:MarR family transcriptional regulator [Cohnella sp. CFH 77786]
MDQKAFFQKLVSFATSVHQVTNEMTKDIKSDDITLVQYGILQYIAVSQPVTLSEISDCQRISMPNTSREIKKLCEKKLCEKVTDPQDRRKQYIRLSRDGEVLMNEDFNRMEAIFLKRIQGASDKEMDEIGRALDLLHTKVFYVDAR